MPIVDVFAQFYADMRRVHRQALQDAVADDSRLIEHQLDIRRFLDARLTEYFRPVQDFTPQDTEGNRR